MPSRSERRRRPASYAGSPAYPPTRREATVTLAPNGTDESLPAEQRPVHGLTNGGS